MFWKPHKSKEHYFLYRNCTQLFSSTPKKIWDRSKTKFVLKKELKIKKEALQKYKSEINDFPHPRSIEALDVIAKKWGTVSGFKSAEAFYLVRELNN